MYIGFEQAVYGSFPFWDRGYDMLAKSPDCRPEWLAWLRETCPKVGQPPAGSPIHGLFALKADRKTWAIVGLSDQGTDDRGRPGAMAFHALFVGRRDYERLGALPFLMAPYLQSSWPAGTRELPAGRAEIVVAGERSSPSDEAARVAADLRRGHRRVIPAQGPIDDLARQVWLALPIRNRRASTLATWSFAEGLGCDLQAIRASATPAGPAETPPRDTRPSRRTPLLPALGLAAAIVGLGLPFLFLATRRVGPRDGPAVVERPEPPPRVGYEVPPNPDEFARLRDRLAVLADRVGVEIGPGDEPSAVMVRLADSAHYRGRWLEDRERNQLRRDPDPEAARALSWDGHVRRFAPDRPLPPGFETGPIRWQLAVLAWSFHLETRVDEPPAEALLRLEDWLSVDVATRPSPLASRHPALDDYGRFLSRLPRR
ncbi:MAG: hypothetical protein U0800_01005 [Isosphaeraceae bacterium]